ncbi:MAG TPA: hypothetical protein VMZ66_04370 [Aeromicrobium sp.]|nr:hypothetical protein [Aeromicrobium sp.]
MSIFEPIPRESHWDEDTQELDEAQWDDDAPTAGFDPRSITIAGLVVIAIVIAGLVASNAADPASRPQPLVPARVNPGAAAVEHVEAKQSAPSADPSASPSVESKDGGGDDAPRWQAPNDSSDDFASSGDSKWDSKPGKGHGNGHGRG